MGATSAELIERARALAPGIAARATEIEDKRAPHDETIQELIDAELMQVLVPSRWGGHELDLATHVEICEILSAACMSTGWIAAFYIGHNWMMTRLSERAQGEVFGDRPFGLIPATTAPTFKAKRANGGWEISGKASWGSGIMHADWIMVGGIADGALPMLFLVPAADAQIEDVWRMSAMSGTGSNDIVLEDVFVPAHRTVSALEFSAGTTEGSALYDNPLYKMPLLPFIYCEVMGVFSGGLRGAAKAFDETVRNRVTTHAMSVMNEKQQSHILLGESQARAMVAAELVREQVRQTEALASGAGFEMSDRVRLKAHAGFIVNHCRESVNDLVHHGGSTNFRREAPLQRFFRDINMLATHAFWEWDSCRELYGRDLLGLEPNHSLI